jgi:2-oxoglutarate ferredoxin oxidoreductase subunit alpha
VTKKLLQGNEAVAQAAVDAGMNFFAGYPITPASEILHYLVNREVTVVQCEDEIASINAAVGGSLAGAKAMTATSGPGFSLMQEGIGFAHMTETPLVVVNVQRVGPSTGMPTVPAQGDIMQCRFGSHGDYFPIVFYPNSVQELYTFTFHAFNASEESESPAVLLSDGFLAHLLETCRPQKLDTVERKRPPFGTGRRHVTGLTSEGGTPKASDPDVHTRMIERFQRKQKEVASRYEYFEYMEAPESRNLVICFGVLSRVMLAFRNKVSILRPIRLFPIIEEIREIAGKYDRIGVIEMNAGQYVLEVEALLNREVVSLPLLGGKLGVGEVGEALRWGSMIS